MRLTKNCLLTMVIIVIVGILLGQLLWVFNMYEANKQSLRVSLDDALTSGLKAELSERLNSAGEPLIIRYLPSSFIDNTDNDSTEFINRTIVSEDTTYHVRVKKNAQDVDQRIFQLILKQKSPLNVNRLNELFITAIVNSGFEEVRTSIELIDLEADTLVAQTGQLAQPRWKTITMDSVPIDIIETLGIRATVALSPHFFLRRMLIQLFLSLVLLAFAVIFTIYLYKTILHQQKVQKMHQDFVNSMVHEFKRPITKAVMMLEIAPSYLAKNEINRAVDYVNGSLRDLMVLASYTNKIQRHNHSDHDSLQLDLEPIMLAPYLKQLAATHAFNPSKTVHIDIVNESTREFIVVDRLHFTNMMDNLMENAVKYSGESVHITLNLKDDNRSLVIAIIDDGNGIPDSEKKRIFEAFYRGNALTKRRIAGFGLGLSYVKAVVEAHKGKIWVEDAPDKGSRFILQLPV